MIFGQGVRQIGRNGSGARCPSGGQGGHAGRQRRQSAGGAEQLAPGEQVRTQRLVHRRPGRPDLDLGRAGLGGHRAEALRDDPGDRAALGEKGRAMCGEGLGEPGPAHPRQQRVGSDLRLQVGAHVGHQPERPLPGLVPGRVVQQDQPAGRELLVVDQDVGGHRHRVRREPGRRGSLLQHDLAARDGRAQSCHGPTERLGAIVDLAAGGHIARVGPRGRSAGNVRKAWRVGPYPARMAALLALLSSVLWGGADFLGGTISRRLPALLVVGASQLAGLVTVAVVAAAVGELDAPTGYLPWAVAAGLAGLGGLVAFYRALAMGTMGVVSPIAALGVVVPVAVGLARGERPAALQLLGIVVAVLGVVMASGPELSGRAGARPLLLAATAAVGFGLALLFIAEGAQTSTLMTLVTMRVTSVLVVALLLVSLARRTPLRISTRDLPLIAVVGIGD